MTEDKTDMNIARNQRSIFISRCRVHAKWKPKGKCDHSYCEKCLTLIKQTTESEKNDTCGDVIPVLT